MKYKILVVEDNTEMRENIMEILEISNYEVIGAEDGILGIQAARDFKPDLIVSDVMMPNLDGLGMLKILQQDEALSSTPLIFLSAKTEKDDFRKGMNLGAEDYIVKPFESKDLLEVIEKKLIKYTNLRSQSPTRRLRGVFNESALLKNTTLNRIIESIPASDIGKNSLLWKPDSHNNTVYFLESGIVKEYINSVAGKDFIINFFIGPAIIGIEKIYQQKHETYAEISEHAKIISIPKSSIEELLEQENLLISYHEFTQHLMGNLQERLSINSYGNVREKVCYHLAQLHQLFKGEFIHLSREDLACYCGMAKETLIRMLTELKNDKLIQLTSEGIKVLNIQKINSEY
ncbi:MAG: response regulator [Saprospiraceae bacterium]|nr:response regulator [Saprospiraceae bacterium]